MLRLLHYSLEKVGEAWLYTWDTATSSSRVATATAWPDFWQLVPKETKHKLFAWRDQGLVQGQGFWRQQRSRPKRKPLYQKSGHAVAVATREELVAVSYVYSQASPTFSSE